MENKTNSRQNTGSSASRSGSRTQANRSAQSNNGNNYNSNSYNSNNHNGNRTQKTAGKKKGKGSKKPASRFRKKLRWFLLLGSLIFSLTALAGILIFYLVYGDDITRYQKEAEEVVSASDRDTFRQSETSLVYDTNDELISVLKGEKDVYYLTYDQIPDYAKEAMISIEDKKFLKHEGVDLVANVRAVLALIQHKGDVTQGASTITQQLARGIFLTNEVSVERKLKEIFIAIELERKYTKNDIMEFYLNNIYFSNGYYGIQAASKGYFNKDVGELSLSQIAYLCAIPNNPTLYDPFEKPENTIKRRDRILKQMYKDGVISKSDYNDAVDEEIELVNKKVSKNNYVETYVFYCATRALMKQQGFEFRNEFKDDADRESYEEQYTEMYNQCQKSLYYEGYRIYTSIDMDKQSELQDAVDENLKDYKDKNEEGIYALQSAAVSIENKTGRVVAIVGGRYQETTGYTLNRAYQSYRQPGSSIKPLIVYTPSFENGYTPDSTVVDEKFEDGPSNSNGKYLGKIKLRTAVEKSINTIAWKLFEELTPKVGLSYLLDMNFNKIDKNDYYPAAALGGLTNGVSPVEMTAGYAALENDGVYREPTCIVKILDSDGNTIIDDKVAKKRIYDENAARMMTDVLTGVITNGTGKGLGLDNMVSAGKTGTTNDKKDGWFMGYTPYYTTGVWVGYDMPKAMEELSGATFPGSIWHQYMNVIHEGLESRDFPPYEDSVPKNETVEESTEESVETAETTEEETIETFDTIEDNSIEEASEEDSWEYPDSEESIDIPEEETSEDDGWTENEDGFGDGTDNGQSSDFENSTDTGNTDWGDGDDWGTGGETDSGNVTP